MSNKTILINGATGGFGSALAPALYNAGYDLILHDKSKVALDELVNYFNFSESRCLTDAFDINDELSVISAVNNAVSKFKKIDALVNLAGINMFGGIQSSDYQEWNDLLQTNINGYFLTAKYVSQNMIANNNGIIINMSSIWGLHGNQNMMAYSTSKHAIEGFTESLKLDLKKHGIKVSSINFGIVNNSFRDSMKDKVDFTNEQKKLMLNSDDIINPVLLILNSSENSLPSKIIVEAWRFQ